MRKLGWLTSPEYDEALHEKIRIIPPHAAFKAPHFTNLILASLPKEMRGKVSTVRTTLDLDLQTMAEERMRAHLRGLAHKNVTNAAVLILDNRTGDILAMVGSADFFSAKTDGEVNGALALRSPGSTLKPFTYGVALEQGMTPASLLPDIETHIMVSGGDFSPKNYDEHYHGPVRVRTALANSYNIPAILVQQRVGTAALLDRLREFGFASLNREPGYYGASLTLGDGEVSLLELTRAYRALANGGVFSREKTILSLNGDISHFVLSKQAAYLVTHILSDNHARIPAFGEDSALRFDFPVAAKTGTSREFRDNWTIGYTTDFTVGVWVGNFDASPMHEVSGVTGAAPIFHDIMEELESKKSVADFSRPPGIVEREICALSGKRPNRFCHDRMRELFIEGNEPQELCDFHQADGVAYPPEYRAWVESEHLTTVSPAIKADKKNGELAIQFPPDGSVFQIDPVLPREYQMLQFRAVVPPKLLKVTWVLDGRPWSTRRPPYSSYWRLKPGNHKLQLLANANSKSSSPEVRFTVLK